MAGVLTLDMWGTLQEWAFWVALICQIIIVIGYFVFFRKEQLVRLALSPLHGDGILRVFTDPFRRLRSTTEQAIVDSMLDCRLTYTPFSL